MSISDDFIKKILGESPKNEQSSQQSKKKSGSIADDFIRKHNYDVDDSFINTFLSDANRYVNSAHNDYSNVGWGNASSSYKSRSDDWSDLNYRAGIVQGWLETNKDRLDEKTYKEYSSFLDGLRTSGSDIVGTFSEAKSYYSQWDTEDDYIKGASENREARQKRYDDNQKRIEELKAGRTFGLDWFLSDAEKEELERLEVENQQYERGEGGWVSKVRDDYSGLTQSADFETGSANRNHGNPTRDELTKYDALIDSSTWYYDENDVLRDAYGNEIVKDASGNLVSPEANNYTVKDRLGIFLSATDRDIEEYMGTIVSGTWGNIIGEGIDGSWSQLYQDEIDIYYYLLNTSGQATADKYLSDMKTELNRRETMQGIEQWHDSYDEAGFLEKIALNAATIPAKFFSSGVGFIEDTVNTIKGEDINPYSYAHSGMHFSQTVRGDTATELDETGFKIPLIDFTLGDIYQTGMSRIDSALATSVFGGGGTVFLGMGAAQEEAYKLYQQGASAEQITLGAFSAGAAEAIWEYVSYGKLKEIQNVGSPGEWVKSILVQGFNEASEEALTEVTNIVTNALIMGSQSDLAELYKENEESAFRTFVDLCQQTAHSAFGGFIGGFGAGATQATSAYADNISQYRNVGNTIRSADGGAKALENLAMDVAGATEGKLSNSIKKQAGKVSGEVATGNGIGKIGAAVKNFSRDVQAGKLYNKVQTANNLANASANQADIAKSLMRNDFDSKTANDIAEALVASYNGQELTKKQSKLLESVKDNQDVQDAISNIMANEQSTMGQRSQNIRDFQGDIYKGAVTKSITEAIRNNTTAKQFTPAGEYEVSDSGKAINTEAGEDIDIKGVSAISNGKMVLELADGTTIDAKSVSFASESDALIYEAVANLGDNISAETANKLIAKYDGSNAEVFARGIAQAYTYGFYGIDRSEMTGEHSLATELTKEQRNYAYGLGEQYRSVKDQADKAKARAMKAPGEKGVFYRDKDGNATDIRSYLKKDGRVLNEMQTTGIEFMEKMSKMMGVRFNVFESWVENGTRYYLDENGKKTEGSPNGFYDPKTGEIYIDLFAGNDFQGTMLFTVAHELTHFMRQWSPEHFTKIAKLVFSHAGFKGSVSSLVADKMNSKRRPDYDTALEEVVADGMETILKDGKVAEFMADVKKTDSKVWEKLKEWFKNFAEFLKKMVDAYSGQSAQTVEGKKVADFSKKLLTQIEQIWAEGAVSAGENYQAALENVVEANAEAVSSDEIITDGAVKYEIREIGNTGKFYVQADRQVLTGDDPALWGKQIESYINEQIRKEQDMAIPTSDGHILLLTGRSAYKLSDQAVSSIGSKIRNMLSSENFALKGRAATHIDELIQVARYEDYKADEDGKHENDIGEDGFRYYYAFFRDFDGQYYRIPFSAGVNAQEETAYSIGKITKRRLPAGLGSSSNEALENGRKPSGDIIYTSEAKSQEVKTAVQLAYEKALKKTGNNENATESNQATEQVGMEIDADTESVAPRIMLSERTWTESDYVQERDKAAQEIAKAIGVSVKKAKAYIDSVNSIAKMIAEDRVRLDYFSSPGRSSFVSNVEYGGSFDFSTLCKKRRLLTGTFTAIQKALPNTALTADEILKIRNLMKEKGLEVSCGLCYVEGSRANMGQFAKEFLKLYKQYYPDAWQPNMADVNTPDGIEWVRINHPECYEQYEYFWNHYGTLKEGDKNLFASQQKPKLYQLHTEYKGEILDKFNDDDNVEEKNLNGGIRLQSFSDFEIVHLIDTMQIIMDMSRVGLAGQAYTKVPDFAWALGDTGLKINLSLIAKGVDENGKLIFDDVEGMPIDTAVALRNRYSKNVGTILVAFNDEQLLAAMADERVDFIIPFHRSQWKKSQYEAMGLPAKTKDYTYMQNEKFIKPQYHEYRGRQVKDKATNYMPNEYWDFSKSGKENAEAYLEMCARNNKRPKFYKLLQNNGDGSYSLKADGSTDGYWKLLIDFKMYDNDGNGSPQMPVKPDFNMEEATRMLNEYSGGHSNFPVAQGIVDEFVQEYKDSHEGAKFSDRVTDPETLAFLNEQIRKGEVTEVYRAMAQDDDGNLYPPMAGFVRKNGKKVINGHPSIIGEWEQSTESIKWDSVDEEFLIREGFKHFEKPTKDYPNGRFEKENTIFYRNKAGEWKAKFHLDKDNGATVDAAYAPYIHTSLSVLNDQFTSAYTRDNLVVVRGYVPNSEVNGVDGNRYQANFADKPVGKTKWHSGVVAAQMPETRTVILSRYFMPIEIVDDAVFAQKTKEMMQGKDIEIPYNVVTPRQRRALEAIGVRIGEARGLKDAPKKADVKYSDRDENAMSDRAKEILASAKPKMIGKNEKADIKFDTVQELFNELNADKDIQALADRVFEVAKEDIYGHYGYVLYPGEPKSHFRLPMAFVGKNDIPDGVHGQFRKDTIWGSIVFSYDYFMDESVAPQNKASTILHEVIHAITCSHIESAYRWSQVKQGQWASPTDLTDFNGVDERIKAGIELIDVFEQVKFAPTESGKQLYGQLTAYEMVAEMANVDFRNFLKKQNLWNRIVDAIKRIFGISKTTAYDAVSDALERILTATTNDADAQRAKTEARGANTRYSDRILMGSLFSGGGTLEAGLAYQMLDKQFGVEYDGRIAAVYAQNHGDHIQVGRVEDFDISKYEDVFYLHASPVCHNFSKAKHGAKELQMDIDSAKATAKHLETAMPQVFTVENAPAYRKSESLKIITDKLTELGYKWDVDVYNSADYGSATSRNRVILRAVKDGELPAKPAKQERTNSWDKVTRDLWDTLPKATLRPSFISAIENTRNLPILDANGKVNVNKPLLILTTTSGHMVTYCWEGDICPTLTTKCGEARLVMPDGNIYAVTPEFMGRIQGLPDDYKYPKEKTRAFTIIGNGIPTHLTKTVVGGVLDSAYEQTHDGQVLYQDRAEDSVSNRSLLANAFEGIAKPEELQKIQEYKDKVALINAEEKKLRELNEQIKELSFAKGPRDKKRISALRFDAVQAANRINTYDKQLLRLEASEPLQKVLNREKKLAYKKAEQRGKEALAEYKAKVEERQKETAEKWKESRKRAVESKERTAMRHKIQSVVGELNQLLLNEDKKRHVPDSMKKAVADALALVNMDTVGAEERAAKYAALIAKETDQDKIDAYTVTMENILRQGEKMGQRLKELRDAYEEIQNSDDPDIANAYDPVIAGSLNELAQSIGNTSLKDMSIEQLQDVYDMYKMVLTRVRDANKSLIDSIKESIANRASRVVGEVRRAGGEHKYRAAILDPVRSFFWNNLKPVYAMEHIGSETMTEAFNNVRAGEDTWAKDVTEARAYYLDKSKKYGYDSWDFDKKYRFKSASELEFELTLEQILALYAYSKRKQAHDHLRLGGFVFDSNIETYTEKGSKILKYKVNTADAHQLTPEILANIIGTLSNEQKGFVDEMQDYLSTVMGAKGNEVTMKMYGVKLFKEKFYFPLKSAKQFMFEQNEVSGEVKIKNSGFTNKVVAKANNPVILSNFMDVWANHVNDMSMYHSFVLPLEDFNRVFNYNSPKNENQPSVSVKGTIQNAYSPAAVGYVKQLITDLNGGAMSDPRETFAKAMTARFKKAKVFSSLSVVIQQPSAIGRAFALVDPKYFHPTKDGMNHDELWTELKQYAPVAIIKEMGYFDTNMGKSTQDFIKAKEYSGFKEKAKALFTDGGYRDEVLSKAPALADEVSWCAIWNAVKRETVAKHKDLRPGSEEFLKVAGERFTEVVTKTQVYDSVLARSANMRSKSGLMSMITSFMAEPTTSINMLEDAIRKSKRGYKGYAARAFASVAVSIILNNALVALVYGGRDDDEDETYLEKYAQSFVSGMLDDINPLTYYPFLKDMWSVLQGYDVERSDMSLISDLADAMKGLVKAYTSEDGDVSKAWWDIAGSVANIGGVPMQNIRREINGGINFVNTVIEDANGRETTWGSMGDALEDTVRDSIPVVGWLPGDTKADKLYDAIVSGDTAYVNRLKGSYETEDAYHNAVRKALRENDPRIKEAAIAGYNGNPSERVRIAKLIIADGFDQDDVVAAINAEVNAMKPDEPAGDPKKKGFYTATDFATEIANGDQASAYVAKEDVIATAQKNGKTEEEAKKSFVSSAKTELKKLFKAGTISEQKLIDTLVAFCDMEKDDAEKYAGGAAFEVAHPELDGIITYSQYQRWESDGQPRGVSLEMFVDVASFRDDGTSNSVKSQEEVALYISSVTSDPYLRDALWCCFYNESTLKNAPWH